MMLQIESLENAWYNISDVNQRGYFIVKFEEEEAKIIPLQEITTVYSSQSMEELIVQFYQDYIYIYIVIFVLY